MKCMICTRFHSSTDQSSTHTCPTIDLMPMAFSNQADMGSVEDENVTEPGRTGRIRARRTSAPVGARSSLERRQEFGFIDKHLKCDTEAEICKRCRISQQSCLRGEPRVKFGRISGPSEFAQDQIWVATPTTNAALMFVDETGDTIAIYCGQENENNPNSSASRDTAFDSTTRVASAARSLRSSSPIADTFAPTQSGQAVFDSTSDHSPIFMTDPEPLSGYHVPERRHSSRRPDVSTPRSCPSTGNDNAELRLHRSLRPNLTAQRVLSHSHEDDKFLEAILIRYYTENLAHWFDLNDPLRHFTTVVPLRSRHSRPLLNAILTASARQLTRARKHRNSSGSIQWRETILSGLNEEKAMQFQNECIRELLDLSSNPTHVMNADLLAAAVILRTDEEMDVLFRGEGEDNQIFLNVARAYIDAQVATVASPVETSVYDASPDASGPRYGTGRPRERVTTPEISNIPITDGPYRPQSRMRRNGAESSEDEYSHSLRQACFWAACRQDVHSSLLKQRPINFPLPYCNAQRSLAPAQDHIWTIRTIVFCADVLEYCYGRRSGHAEVTPAYTNVQRWETLKQRHTDIIECLPDSFDPTFFRDPKGEDGDVFPQVWFQDPCYATGIGHLELARILLTVFNPSIPRLGLGNVASLEKRNKSLKDIVLKLCGIAVSNCNTPPNFINAFTAIVLCGEYFSDPEQQAGLLRLLDSMQFDFAYYTEHVAERLKSAWQQNSRANDRQQYS